MFSQAKKLQIATSSRRFEFALETWTAREEVEVW